jgi:type II secretory pathway component PulF
MPQFSYKARDAAGTLIEGTLDAADRAAAMLLIEKKRCTPIRIELTRGAKPASKQEAGNRPFGRENLLEGEVRTLSYNHQFLFTEQLAHLLGAGMTLDEALEILVRRLKQPKLQSLSRGLHRALVDGRSLSQALRNYPKIFSPLYINMVAAGEASGALAEILRRLTVHLSDVKGLRDRVKQALVYPSILVVAGIGLIIVFMTVMVPQLTKFFTESGQDLPAATQMLLSVNHFLTRYWWLAVLAVAGLFGIHKIFIRTPEGQYTWDKFLLKVPGYGGTRRYSFYAQFARTMGTLVDNGVTMLKSLELLEEISGNEYIRQEMVKVREAVIDGANLSKALRPHHLFPELFLDMMAVGEQTGRFGETMHMIAGVYERELDNKIKVISALIPPIVMIAIAAVVGLIVFGILAAVFNLTTGLRTRISP